MESELGEIDAELAKLEADQAQAQGEAKQSIGERIRQLLDLRARITAQGDILLATGADDPLRDEAEEAREQIQGDIP